MKILITGGCGFIGRHFARHFLDQGDEVTIVDNLTFGAVERHEWMYQPQSIDKLRLMIGDCRSFFVSSGKMWAPNVFDLVIHCAAVVGGKLKMEDDPLAIATNMSVDSALFDWVVRYKPTPRVIYFSSSAVYPVELQTERSHCSLAENLLSLGTARIGLPEGMYGFCKLAGEYMARSAVEKYGLDVKIYRPFGGYGEDQHKNYPFPAIVRRVVKGENPVMVWGSGDQERDFIHVDDVVSAVAASMDVMEPGEVLNIGTGIATSFFALAERVVKLSGRKLAVRNDPHKPEGVFSRVADTYKMQGYYKPRIGLDEGIKRALFALDDAKEAV
jgi:nucleoside-diphosphate-sugar epimerase